MNNAIVEGVLVDVDGVRHGQVVIERGIIVAVGQQLGRATHRFSDECLIFAGMGDVHIHARQDVSGRDNYKETFATAASAALHGGVLHVADMPNNPVAPVDDASYAAKEALLAAEALPVTFTLYAGIGPGTRPLQRTVPYKAYMGPSVGELYFRSLEQLDETLQAYRGRAVSFHCEDPILLEQHKGAKTHEERRPPICEVSATRFALAMIEKYDLQGKLCHYSVAEGLPLIRAAKARGLAVTAEVTPHHVFFDTSMLTDANRPWMQMNPPLRSPADRAAMLEALRDGTADFLATDHAPHTLAEKERGMSGQPHLDTYGPFVTWLLVEQGFRPERVAELCAANPGSFVQPYWQERFGRLLPGYAGTLTVLNLKKPTVVRRADLRTRCGWSPFEGITFPGSVAAVFVRGTRVGGEWLETYEPSSLPMVSTVEVVVLRGVAPSRFGGFLQAESALQVVVEGKLALQIADLWRRLPPGETARCHEPPFALRFVADGQIICQGSICWECNNIYGDIRGEPFFYEFDAADEVSQALLTELQRLTKGL